MLLFNNPEAVEVVMESRRSDFGRSMDRRPARSRAAGQPATRVRARYRGASLAIAGR